MSEEITKKRLDYIDISKALGMMLIMWGHVIEYGISHNFVYAFHIPLFFTLSGMVFSRERYPNLKIFLTKKIKSLLIPYTIFSLLTWIIWVGFTIKTEATVSKIWMPLAQTIIAQGSGGFLVHNVPLWFITCLFVMETLYYFISKLPSYANLLICIILMVIGVWMQQTTIFNFKLLPWNIEVAFAALIFFSLGNLFIQKVSHKTLIEWIKYHKMASFLIVSVGFIATYIIATYNGKVSMGSCRLHNPFLFYPGAIFGTISMITLCVFISFINYKNTLMKFTLWFGKNSFNAMAIHNPIKGIAVLIVAAMFNVSKRLVSSSFYGIIAFILLFIATTIGIIIINKVTVLINSRRTIWNK